MGPLETLFQAGLGFTAAWDKPGGFIGREALLEQRDAGPLKTRLVQFLLDDPEPVLTHNEPILRDGERVGHTLSSGYAHTLGACAAMGYIKCEDGVTVEFVASGRYQLEQANRTHELTASLKPMYDPTNARIRC
jgi:glycine cleavage system aminomethyltransferase T